LNSVEKKLKELLNCRSFSFSNNPSFDQEANLSCNCAGFITLLLKATKRFPQELPQNPRAFEYFDYAKDNSPKTHISSLAPYDCLMWRKHNIPLTGGDSGHILILKNLPTLKERTHDHHVYEVDIYDVTRSNLEGPSQRKIALHTDPQGNLIGVQWNLKEPKVKRTPLIALSFFKRTTCKHCSFVPERCLCDALPKERTHAPDIVILRHPHEKNHAFASAHLLDLFFKNQVISDGEVFDSREGTLVYPYHVDLTSSEEINICEAKGPLILLDGTWKKTKKILHKNPWLQALPRLKVGDLSEGEFSLRKTPSQGKLSTLETYLHVWRLKENSPKQEELEKLFKTYMLKQQSLYSS